MTFLVSNFCQIILCKQLFVDINFSRKVLWTGNPNLQIWIWSTLFSNHFPRRQLSQVSGRRQRSASLTKCPGNQQNRGKDEMTADGVLSAQ